MAKRARPVVHLTVNYVPLPPERAAAWRASLLLLVKFLLENCDAPEPADQPECIAIEVSEGVEG